MADDARTLTRLMVEHWNDGEYERIFGCFDPAIVVRPDPNYPEGPLFGSEAAREFWESFREMMGGGKLIIETDQGLGDRAYQRIHQAVHSPTGVESGWAWSWITTWRNGRLVLAEFFIDDAVARAAIGLAPDQD